MSTDTGQAYRLLKSDFQKFVALAYEETFPRAAREVLLAFAEFVQRAEPSFHTSQDVSAHGLLYKFRNAAGLDEAANSRANSEFDFRVWAVCQFYGRYVYVRPMAYSSRVRGVWDWLDSCDFVQEYHYQDKTDRPDRIPAREWRARRRTWDRLCDAPYHPVIVEPVANIHTMSWLRLEYDYIMTKRGMACVRAIVQAATAMHRTPEHKLARRLNKLEMLDWIDRYCGYHPDVPDDNRASRERFKAKLLLGVANMCDAGIIPMATAYYERQLRKILNRRFPLRQVIR